MGAYGTNLAALQDYEGKLSFGTDTWTSPNHRAFVAISVHLEVDGQPLRLLLDLVEVAEVRTCMSQCAHLPDEPWGCPQSHTGVNLAATFAQVLEDFGIQHKVSMISNRMAQRPHMAYRSWE